MKRSPTQTALARLGAASATMIAIGILASPSHAQCQYDVTVLQFPIDCGIGTVITTGLSLNDNGAVVGRYKCPVSKYSQGFLWTAEGGFVGLKPPPGVIQVVPTDINDQGVICGTMIVADIGFRGFVYDRGVWTVLPPVVDMLGTWSSAAAISNAGVVVGQRSITENLNPQNAYIWSPDLGFTDLGVMNGPYSSATDISQGGAVTGWTGLLAAPGDEAFIWVEGELTLLGPIPGGLWSDGNAVADERLVAGSGRIPIKGDPATLSRGFVWENGQFTIIEPIEGYDHSGAGGINSHLEVAGACRKEDNPNDWRGFLWRNGITFDLNDLITSPEDILVTGATALNEARQIAAFGHNAQGELVSFLLTLLVPLGDLDGDCTVGITDLLLLLQQWGMTNSPADLNGDGTVGILDLLILLANWGS